MKKGNFTLPGESGYEKLTLRLAKQWGADVIRDSDGTKLSPEILQAGYDIYSTVCVIREHNEFAKKNPETQMQTVLQSFPVIAEGNVLSVSLLDGYFKEQFCVNGSEHSQKYWQVFDRTDGQETDRADWEYNRETQTVRIKNCKQWHKYTVNFFAYRIWEEISMYNHITNDWEKEHLRQIDPVHPKVRKYLLSFMEEWCRTHESTSVVRFTSMFYNFVWIWGENVRNRFLFTDWASYDFTASPEMFELFMREKGYNLTCENFINGGKRHNNHMPADKIKRDYMDFIMDFVLDFGKQLIDIVHRYGKKAYVFYDDSWIGIEPYSNRFAKYGFDGLIKCVFSGFEARMCAGVSGVPVHELRLHPYLFPTGLSGEPVFAPGGDPLSQAKRFWVNIRRALLRQPVDRIGLGGYLHLVEAFPDFCEYIEEIANEFRQIQSYHADGAPYCLPVKISVLTHWGKLRTWTCGGHFHEHPDLDLINLLESLSGLPVNIEFIDFEELKEGRFTGNVLLNAGLAASAWSGGDEWKDSRVVEQITRFVEQGGMFLGVNESSEVCGFDTNLRLAHLFGVDLDRGEFNCHGRYPVSKEESAQKFGHIEGKKEAFVFAEDVCVLRADEGKLALAQRTLGKGRCVYMASYRHSAENARMLLQLLCGEDLLYVPDRAEAECAYFPASKKLVVINNSGHESAVHVRTEKGSIALELKGYETIVKDL